MRTIKKYQLFKIRNGLLINKESGINDKEFPSFDTKKEAIEYASNTDRWDEWYILNQISFYNFED